MKLNFNNKIESNSADSEEFWVSSVSLLARKTRGCDCLLV